jgi:hypothetical protein
MKSESMLPTINRGSWEGFGDMGETKIPSRRFATEGSRSIISHGNKTKQKHSPRINTEFHGNKQKQKIRPGNITHLSEPEVSATVALIP